MRKFSQLKQAVAKIMPDWAKSYGQVIFRKRLVFYKPTDKMFTLGVGRDFGYHSHLLSDFSEIS